MINAGGLIRLHYHNNFQLLELFSEVDGILYFNALSLFKNLEISQQQHNYLTKESDGLFVDGTFIDKFSEVNGVLYFNGNSLFDNVEISQQQHNHLTKENDGLFVDGTFIDRFDYDDENDELLFDDIIVSREYNNQDVTNAVESLWTQDPFHILNTINVNYLIKTIVNNTKQKLYKNNSYNTIIVTITNTNEQRLKIKIGEELNISDLNDIVNEPEENSSEESTEPITEPTDEPTEPTEPAEPTEPIEPTDEELSELYNCDVTSQTIITYNLLPNKEIAIATFNEEDLTISITFQ